VAGLSTMQKTVMKQCGAIAGDCVYKKKGNKLQICNSKNKTSIVFLSAIIISTKQTTRQKTLRA
jgi:hypothetical protein